MQYLKSKKKDVFLIPGNHDVQVLSTRNNAIKTIIQEKNNPEKYKDYLKDLKVAFSSYSKFVKKFYGEEVADERVSKPDEVICQIWDDKLNIILLNTALISDKDKEHGEIIDIRALSEIIVNKELPTLVLAHHDFHNICDAQKDRMRILFENFGVRAYLCGDVHKEKVNFIVKYDDISHKIPCIICGKSVVQLMDDYSDVGIVYYTWKDNGFVYVTPYEWTKNHSFYISNKFNNGRKFQFSISYKEPIIYPSLLDAHDDIARDIQQGTFFKFYGLRGQSFLGGSEGNRLTQSLEQTRIQTQFLISYPFSKAIEYRLKNIQLTKDDDNTEKWRNICNTARNLKRKYKDSLRFHNMALLFRLLITDNHLYFGYYEPGKPTDNSSLYRFDKDTPTYKTYKEFFDCQWKIATHDLPEKIPAKYSFLKKKISHSTFTSY